MMFSIKTGDYVVTPYSNRPCITANKLYHVIRKIGDSIIELKDDTGMVHQYNIHIFFEADAYFTWSLYRIIKQLTRFKDKLLTC